MKEQRVTGEYKTFVAPTRIRQYAAIRPTPKVMRDLRESTEEM